ncbi:multiple cyclophane-containing RiPP AmcA [Streptomyces sp. NPDC006670]|uniref:multiple cyclophane-containing RiPP AmcA n=1 Tax=Streptomyces sp. NPDC006670 TaxID=3154476 RepID=UPI0033DB10E6
MSAHTPSDATALVMDSAGAFQSLLPPIGTQALATFDNRPTWDNPTPGSFDNRPTWDDWSKSEE